MSALRYRLATVDLARPLPAIALDAGERGIGLTVELDGRPIGFVLRALPRGAALDAAAVARLLGRRERTAALAERIRCELLAAVDAAASVPRALVPVPSVSAVVCTHDRPDLLARCLGSLVAVRERGAPGVAPLEILVVDNAPSDPRAQDVAARFPAVRYVCEPIIGLDFARNRALREASGDFIAYFDDDVWVEPAWLEGFAEAVAEHPDAAAVTGPVLPLELDTRAQIEFERLGGFGRRFEKMRFGTSLPGNWIYPCGPGMFGTGCNMALRRDVVCRLGGFDEALDTGAALPGGGDLDMFYRLVSAGHVLVSEPRCLVRHAHRREDAVLRRQLWTWGLGLMAFAAKTYRADPARRPQLRGLVRWWVLRGARLLARRARGRAAPPMDLVLAELAGGVAGWCGAYGRSQRRVARLRGAAAARPASSAPERP